MRAINLLVLAALCVTPVWAADQNPFAPQSSSLPNLPAPQFGGMAMPASGVAPQAQDDASQMAAFNENRSALDTLELIGRSGTHATFRYLLSGAGGMQGVSYRTALVKQGGDLQLGGRSYRVFMLQSGEVQLLKKGQVVWANDLTSGKVYYAPPNEYEPPLSAGYGVGQSVNTGDAAPGPALTGASPTTGGTPGGAMMMVR